MNLICLESRLIRGQSFKSQTTSAPMFSLLPRQWSRSLYGTAPWPWKFATATTSTSILFLQLVYYTWNSSWTHVCVLWSLTKLPPAIWSVWESLLDSETHTANCESCLNRCQIRTWVDTRFVSCCWFSVCCGYTLCSLHCTHDMKSFPVFSFGVKTFLCMTKASFQLILTFDPPYWCCFDKCLYFKSGENLCDRFFKRFFYLHFSSLIYKKEPFSKLWTSSHVLSDAGDKKKRKVI